jgi:telomerase reverse transcriptase
MAKKRKRTRRGTEGDTKRQKLRGNNSGRDPVVKQALLAQYYPRVFNLREYLLYKLPATSKIRRKKILNLGREQSVDSKRDCSALSDFLDHTLIGVLKCNEVLPEERIQQWTSFSQRLDTSNSALVNLSGTGNLSQSEVSVYLVTVGVMRWNVITT